MRNRFKIHHRRLFFDYKITREFFINQHSKNEWMTEEYWFVSIGFENKFFGTNKIKYDGIWAKAITILGIKVSCGYEYVSKSVKDWLKDKKVKL